MPDRETAPDPMDKAYAQAEAVLDDGAARAGRRARVLAAVAQPVEAPLPASTPSKPRVSWRHGGWLAAASVAGLSVLIALRLDPARDTLQNGPPADAPTAAAPSPSVASGPTLEARARSPSPPPRPAASAASAASAIAPRPETGPSPSVPQAPEAPPRPPALQNAPTPPPSAPAAPDGVEEVVVTGSQVQPQPKARAASASRAAPVPASSAARADRLRAAAAAGRIAEMMALLDQETPVDVRDGDGETALMKAIQGAHPAAAALLRRHGADLDVRNSAGLSARDMAASIDDAELNRALGLAP